MVQIDGAEADHGAERALPGKGRQLQWYFRIGLELQAVGAGSVLVLVDHERTDAANAVIAEMPAGAVAIGGARERHPAEDQEIASAIEELLDARPGLFGKGGAVGKDQESRGGRCEGIAKVFGAGLLCYGEQRGELLRSRSGRVGGGKSEFREDDHGRGGGLGKECEWDEHEEDGGDCEEYRCAHDGLILRDAKGWKQCSLQQG